MSKKVKTYLKDPHILVWGVLFIFMVGVLIFFDHFKQYFVKIVLIGIIFLLFYFFDDFLFKAVGNSVKDLFSQHLFVKRWKAFPIFLIEIYLTYFLSNLIEIWLNNSVSTDKINRWWAVIWLIIMFIFYWFKGSRED